MESYFDCDKYEANCDARDETLLNDEEGPSRDDYSYDQVACDQRDYTHEWRSSKCV